MSQIILFILEGEKTEPQIFESLKSEIFSKTKDEFLYCCYKTHIYSLYQEIKKDTDCDIVELLREKNNELLSEFKRDDISQIYLFFDYDPQASESADKIIPEMLQFFDNETENGKLFISYPMAEALKQETLGDFLLNHRTLSYTDISKYKEKVHHTIEPQLRDFNNYNFKIWQDIFKKNLQQANWLLHNEDSIPTLDTAKKITQNIIYNEEYSKFIKNKIIAILSAFPLFILDYFTKEFIEKEIISPNLNT